MANKVTKLEFSQRLESVWLTNVKNYRVAKRTIVTNIGEKAAWVCVKPKMSIPARSSTILQDVTIESADSLVLINVLDKMNLGGITLDKGWSHYQHYETTDKIPLYTSPQFEVGTVSLDPFFATGATEAPVEGNKRNYKVKVNLWFCPEKTNCGIHNSHTDPERLEVHTQISGVGRMQKFHEQDFDTIYAEVILGEGQSHVPFAGVNDDGSFYYQWHQYFSDTDCIWMSYEYHLNTKQ